jgi:hypothetical protein
MKRLNLHQRLNSENTRNYNYNYSYSFILTLLSVQPDKFEVNDEVAPTLRNIQVAHIYIQPQSYTYSFNLGC